MSDSDAYVAALRILRYRFNSEGELRRKLRAKKFDAETIDATIAKLRAEKWLDDERFAAAFVRTRQRKRIGPQRIKRELGAAGVSQDTIKTALNENENEAAEEEALTALTAKRMRILGRRHGEEWLESVEGRQKIAAYLVHQGYDLGDALKAIAAARGGR